MEAIANSTIDVSYKDCTFKNNTSIKGGVFYILRSEQYDRTLMRLLVESSMIIGNNITNLTN